MSNPLNDPRSCFKQCEDCAKTLNQIAEKQSGDSPEAKAISFAKKALLFVATRRCAEFEAFLEEMYRGLSPEQEARLKRLGIDIDSDI